MGGAQTLRARSRSRPIIAIEPLAPGLEMEALRTRLPYEVAPRAFRALVDRLGRETGIVREEGLMRLERPSRPSRRRRQQDSAHASRPLLTRGRLSAARFEATRRRAETPRRRAAAPAHPAGRDGARRPHRQDRDRPLLHPRRPRRRPLAPHRTILTAHGEITAAGYPRCARCLAQVRHRPARLLRSHRPDHPRRRYPPTPPPLTPRAKCVAPFALNDGTPSERGRISHADHSRCPTIAAMSKPRTTIPRGDIIRLTARCKAAG